MSINHDIKNRVSQKDKRIEESVEEFSISQLVRAGMSDYTANLKEVLGSDSRQIPKKILAGMFEGDEATLALITLRTVISVLISQADGKILLSSLGTILTTSVINAKTLAQLDSEHKALSSYIDQVYKRGSDSKRLKAKMRSARNLIEKTKEEIHLSEGSHTTSIGSMLISVLCESIDIIELVKLDSKSRWQGTQYNQYPPFSYLVQFTDETKYALLDLDASAREFIKPTVLPLLKAPTKVVDSWDNGDSDVATTGRPRTLIKMPRKKQNLRDYKYTMDLKSTEGYKEIHGIIEETEWTINTEVHDVISSIFEENIVNADNTLYKGEHFEFNPELLGGLPRRFSLEPDSMIDKAKLGRVKETSKGFIMFDDDKEGLNKYNRIKNDLLAFNEANLNKALSLQSMLEIAKQYKHKAMWFTYQYDSRSRIYPVQSGLHPQSDKKGKALLKFGGAGAKKLTEEGHYWAKVHGANTWGLDKAPLDDRVAFIDELIRDGNLKKIAEYPLIFTDLWSKTDDAFGFLAFCIEYNKVLKDPEHRYAIACALDATCSGLQIYAGLLKDADGAKEVNVIGKTRNDVYGSVAKVANYKLTNKEYERYQAFTNSNGEEDTIDYQVVGNSLAGMIDRSISKRNTMTQPYSVTMKGMQDQLKDTFTELELKGKKFWKGEVWQCSKLLASIHQEAIDEVVPSAKKGKEFIKAIASKCASVNQGLLYTTHIGFPVYQKNVKAKSLQINTHIWTPDKGNQRVQFRVNKRVGRVNTHSQKNSSAPNLIHSLDSSLLHLTVKKCHAKGVNAFALIHDSYGVHPNDVPILNVAVREAFVEIFNQDVLYDWAIEVLTNAGFSMEQIMVILEELEYPLLDTLDFREVLEAIFMFS